MTTTKGSTANDLILMTPTTTTIDGGLGRDTVLFQTGDMTRYKIAKNADGSLTVTDLHATGQSVRITNVETLRFANNMAYDVATGTFSQAAPLTAAVTMTDTTLTGTAANDALMASAAQRIIDGGAGSDTVSFTSGNVSRYRIDKNTDGSLTVIDTATAGLSWQIRNAETLRFANNVTYDVATGKLSGSTTNDTVTASTSYKIIDGGAGTDVVSFGSADFTKYQIARKADGSLTVTDIVTKTAWQLRNVETLRFGNGVYDVAAAKFISSASSGTTAPAATLTAKGSTANDRIIVMSSTAAIDGGLGRDTVLFQNGDMSWYKIAKNADGSLTVTDIHATGQSVRITNVETLRFANNMAYDVATGTFSQAAPLTAAVTMTDTTLTGTAANDALMASAAQRIIDGGAGSDTVSFTSGNVSRYRIDKNADGSLTVTDTATAGLSWQIRNAETLRFANNVTYDVATGKLSGSTTNDTVTASTSYKIIDGGAGTDVVLFGSADFTKYQIARKADGSLTVTDIATKTAWQLRNVETLRFGNGDYDVAAAKYTPTTPSSSPGTPVPTPPVPTPPPPTSPTPTAPIPTPPAPTPPAPTPPPPTSPTSTATQTGTAGNDQLTASTSNKAIDGGGGTDTVVFNTGDASAFKVSKAADGTVTVTEIASGNSWNIKNVETVRFADDVAYDVASGTTVVKATEVPKADQSNEIVGLHIKNTTDHAEGSHVVTFGQSFAQGDLPAGSKLVAIVDGKEVPVQMDVKATNDDGSVRHAIITLKAPGLDAHDGADVMLVRGTPTVSAGATIQPADILAKGYDTKVALTFHNADGSTQLQNIDVAAALRQAIQDGSAKAWMSGPLATEMRIDVPINERMHATFDIRASADGTIKTDLQVHNDAAYKAIQTYNYDVTVTEHGSVVYSQAGISHYSFSSWHEEIWSGGKAQTDFITLDTEYLIESGAIQSFDTSLGVNYQKLTDQLSKLAQADTGPMGSAMITEYMPMTGGRADIGPTTQWSANFLAAQSENTMKLMLANADAAGSIPWHLRDTDGSLLTRDDHPKFWLDGRYTGADKIANLDSVMTESGWKIDTAHAPDLSYVSYLVTGNHYYLDQLQTQSNAEQLSYSPSYAPDGNIVYGQARSQAWTLRDMFNTAYITPDNHDLKTYFDSMATKNIDWFVKNYVVDGAANKYGDIEGFVKTDHADIVAPWQQDMLAIVMTQAARQGFSNAADFAAWQENFLAGRFLHGEDGFNPLHGTGYWPKITDPATGQPVTTWKQFYDVNFGTETTPPTKLDGNPDAADSYSGYARASMAALHSVSHSADTIEAFAFIVQNTPKIETGVYGFNANHAFDITPILKNGHHLLNTEITAVAANSTMTSSSDNSVMAAVSGNNLLIGGNKIDVLMGGSGNDILRGGAGDDYLFGGSGQTRLEGGAGENYLKGDIGKDVFVFNTADVAKDTLVNFRPSQDMIEVKSNGTVIAAQDIIDRATADAHGDTVLHLGAQHEVTLVGLQPNQLDSHWFYLT